MRLKWKLLKQDTMTFTKGDKMILGENIEESMYKTCWNCNGSGQAETYDTCATCWICGGSGTVKKKERTNGNNK